jgi:putative oxidoreductase
MVALGLFILRLVVGLTVAGHGAQKLFGWWGGPGMTGWTGAMTRMRIRPAVPWAWMSALAELGGGLLVALGFLNPLGSFALAGSMLVAMILVHWPKGFWLAKGGYEYNLVILSAAAAIAIAGPGAYSLDSALGIHLPEPWLLIIGGVATVAGVALALGTRVPAAAPKPQMV